MSKSKTLRRWIAIVLAVALLPIVPFQSFAADTTSEQLNFNRVDASPNIHLGTGVPAGDELAEAPYADTDVVRVSIVVTGKSTLDAGFDAKTIATDSEAVAYRDALQAKQDKVAAKIAADVLEGKELDVVWNLTLAANIISANVEFGKISAIKSIAGVKDVFIETQYAPSDVKKSEAADPNMSTSSSQIGSSFAWSAGFTGVGRKIAIIDTGADVNHVSFNAGAFEYSIAHNAGLAGYDDVDKYKEDMNLMTAEDIAAVLEQLNAFERGVENADDLYRNIKFPFAYNYVDGDFDVSHENDRASEHGSHVTGIAAANAYVPTEDGKYVKALNSVMAQGVAPDAQVVTMKVFGKNGGASDSDYFAAVEDAIVLGCDSANLSLGSASPGWGNSTTYEDILNKLTESGLVMVTSAGNSYSWADFKNPWYDPQAGTYLGYLYGDDVSFHTGGVPGSFAETLGVASVENAGTTGLFIYVGDNTIVYNETEYSNAPFTTLAGDLPFIYLNDVGTAEQFAEIASLIKGKVVLCNRGETSFYQKANAAFENGAAALIIVNNQPGIINMDLTDYTGTIPVVSITQADGEYFKIGEQSFEGTEVTKYYTGTVTVGDKLDSTLYGDEYYTMSDFSAWGIPQSLTLKPEITAPGGNIYSVNGAHADSGDGIVVTTHDQYEMMSGTSMAAPQVTGMVALVDQFLEEMGYAEKENLSLRKLALSLLMSTSVPMEQAFDGTNSAGLSHYYYPVLNQGAGLANVGNAVSALSYILMNADATESYADGKVKAELGASEEGKYSYSFTLNNLNGKENSYTLSTELFTQDLFAANFGTEDKPQIEMLLDKWATPLSATVVYTVNGETFVPTAALSADVNKDGVTDSKDACAILMYLVEKIAADDDGYDFTVADVDGDGKVTSYDSYLILSNLETGAFTVPADGSVEVKVEITVDPEAVEDYENGAYVEGYTFVEPVSGEDGLLDVTHSIPIIGFFGNWSDPSMYDQNSYIESLYGDDTIPYVAESIFMLDDGRLGYQTNFLSYTDPIGNEYAFIGNPYGVEETFPADKAAMNSASTLSQIGFSLIRNAATMAYVITDADTNEILYASNPTSYSQDNISAYFHVNAGYLVNSEVVLTANKKLSSLPTIKDGSTKRVSVSFVAIPEYYLTDEMLAETEDEAAYTITAEEFISILPQLGEGAFLTSTFKIDDKAPTLLGADKNLANGDLTITANDNEDIAAIAVLTRSGSKVYDMTLAPETDENGNAKYTFKAAELGIGSKCMILVADYAGNESTYVVEYGGEDPDYSGKIYAYVGTNLTYTPELTNAWVNIDPETLTFNWLYDEYTGIEIDSYGDGPVSAAEYVEGYVFSVSGSNLYVAEMMDLASTQLVGDLSMFGVESVKDLAYDMSTGTLYAMSDYNEVYSIDMLTGEATFVFAVDVEDVLSPEYATISTLAVDDEGNFYGATQYGSDLDLSHLVTWSLDDVVDGTVTVSINDAPAIMSASDAAVRECDGSMAWDHSTDTLYLANSYGMTGPDGYTQSVNNTNYLWTVNTETGVATPVNSVNGDEDDAHTYFAVRGLFIVPGRNASGPDFGETDEVLGFSVSEESVELLIGGSTKVGYTITPWTLSDKTVTWTSADEKVATVNEFGVITGVSVGSTTVTVTSNIDSTKTATINVTVKPIPSMTLSAIIFDDDNLAYHAQYDTSKTENWEKFEDVAGSENPYMGGTLVDDTLYVYGQDGILYAIDADTFEVTKLGAVDFPIGDAAPVPTFVNAGYYFVYTYMGYVLLGEPYNLPDHNLGTGWNMSSYITNDAIAAFAYEKTAEFEKATNLADYIYMITEKGDLWQLIFYDNSYMARQELGYVEGVNLEGVSEGNGYASLAFKKDETGKAYLVLTSYIEGIDDDSAKMQLIDLDQMKVVASTTFGENIWPVISNYEHVRLTDLTLKLDKSEVNIYEDGTATVTAKVKLYDETDAVTWTTSDANVATVDENGVITGMGAGTATITATTVDTNDKGEHVSATVTVTVKGKQQLVTDTSVGGQLSNGAWVDVPLDSIKSYSNLGVSEGVVFSGGGMAGDGLYGSDVDFENYVAGASVGTFYHLNYNLEVEEYMDDLSGFFAPVDMTFAPALDVTINGQQFTAFGKPMYIPYDSNTPNSIYWAFLGMEDPGRGMYMLDNLEEGSIMGTYADILGDPSGNFASAIAFGGLINWRLITSEDIENAADVGELFYVLTADSLYIVVWIPVYDAETDSLGYTMLTGRYGYLDKEFPVDYAVTMDVADLDEDGSIDGLVVGYSGDGAADLYYIDMMADGYVLPVGYLGTIAGSNSITSLFFSNSAGATADSVKNVESLKNVKFEKVEATASVVKTSEVEELAAVNTYADVKVPDEAMTRFVVDSKQTAGSLNAAEANEAAPAAEESDTYTVEVKADDTTNGLYTVEYDATLLTLVSVTGNTEYFYYNETAPGVIKMAFASATSVDGVLATVKFAAKTASDEDVTTDVDTTTEESGKPSDSEPVTEKTEVVIPGTGHEYGEPEFTWSEDNSSATAKFECENGDSTVTVDATVTSEVKKEATCTEAGTTTLTATVEFEGKTYTATKDVEVPATGNHNFVDGKCTVCGTAADAPVTGDNSQVFLLVVILAISALGLAITFCTPKSKKHVR